MKLVKRMSEINSFVEKLYQYTIDRKISDAEDTIIIHMDFLHHADKYNVIDSILYNIDFNKVHPKIIKALIYRVGHYSDKIVMRKEFIERAKEFYGDRLS